MVAGLRGLPRGFGIQLQAVELGSQTAIKLTRRAQDLKDCETETETETPVSGRRVSPQHIMYRPGYVSCIYR